MDVLFAGLSGALGRPHLTRLEIGNASGICNLLCKPKNLRIEGHCDSWSERLVAILGKHVDRSQICIEPVERRAFFCCLTCLPS